MGEILFRVGGHDPLMFRDGRPFANERGALAAFTLREPRPGTLAGVTRTRIGHALGWKWDQEASARALQIGIRGPVLMRGETPYFPAPADALIYEKNDGGDIGIDALKPAADMGRGGCNLPNGLRVIDIPIQAKRITDRKYWSVSNLKQWLFADGLGDFTPPPPEEGPPVDVRVHVNVQMKGEGGGLFTTEGIVLDAGGVNDTWSYLVRAEVEGVADAQPALARTPVALVAMGGERRLGRMGLAIETLWPDFTPSDDLEHHTVSGVRMYLATPALFADGWKPGWLNDDLRGTPPGTSITLQLVSACVARREAVSGWDFQRRGPKPVRWLAPSGSVYFFKVVDGSPQELMQSQQLVATSDEAQDRRDSYGLAVWGIWSDGGVRN